MNPIHLEEIVFSNFFLTLSDPDALDAFAAYLCYCVQRDLYEVCLDLDILEDTSWQSFLATISYSEPMQKASLTILKYGVLKTCTERYFNFDLHDIQFPFQTGDLMDGAEGDTMSSIRIFSPDEGRIIVSAVLLRAQVVYYHLHEKDRSWPSYMEHLMKMDAQRKRVLNAFYDAIFRLDFKPFWRREDLVRVIVSQWEPLEQRENE